LFKNNIAHSVSYDISYGQGFVFRKNKAEPDHINCFEMSHVTAYKIYGPSVAAITETKE